MPMTPEDYEEIRRLVARYNFGLDFMHPEDVADTFTEEGTFWVDSPLYSSEHAMGGKPTGREELIEYYRSTGDTLQGLVRHWNNGTAIIEGDGETATMRSYMMNMKVGWGPDPAQVLGTGLYYDELVKVNGEWKFKLRHWTSDPQPEHRGNAFLAGYAPDGSLS
jgi:hypothetical protein